MFVHVRETLEIGFAILILFSVGIRIAQAPKRQDELFTFLVGL
jgi:hypothetical protein